MALEDRDIFQAICTRFADQPIEFIMTQYAQAKRMNMEIERMLAWDLDDDSENEEELDIVETEDVASPAKRRLNKRSFKVKPEDSITEDYIRCCICGEERQSLTAKHLAKHDVTVEEYKRACGFEPDKPLMSGKRLKKSKDVIARAQKARLEKHAAKAQE
ncbi:MAG: MucR family transcriptional regulator [Desulfovibrio sp.]|nr:MucR family transcriptional regulator [Desulfovibrio sp.]